MSGSSYQNNPEHNTKRFIKGHGLPAQLTARADGGRQGGISRRTMLLTGSGLFVASLFGGKMVNDLIHNATDGNRVDAAHGGSVGLAEQSRALKVETMFGAQQAVDERIYRALKASHNLLMQFDPNGYGSADTFSFSSPPPIGVFGAQLIVRDFGGVAVTRNLGVTTSIGDIEMRSSYNYSPRNTVKLSAMPIGDMLEATAAGNPGVSNYAMKISITPPGSRANEINLKKMNGKGEAADYTVELKYPATSLGVVYRPGDSSYEFASSQAMNAVTTALGVADEYMKTKGL